MAGGITEESKVIGICVLTDTEDVISALVGTSAFVGIGSCRGMETNAICRGGRSSGLKSMPCAADACDVGSELEAWEMISLLCVSAEELDGSQH